MPLAIGSQRGRELSRGIRVRFPCRDPYEAIDGTGRSPERPAPPSTKGPRMLVAAAGDAREARCSERARPVRSGPTKLTLWTFGRKERMSHDHAAHTGPGYASPQEARAQTPERFIY